MSSKLKNAKDAENSKRLPPAPDRWRGKPQEWPYHNNLGTSHKGKNKD